MPHRSGPKFDAIDVQGRFEAASGALGSYRAMRDAPPLNNWHLRACAHVSRLGLTATLALVVSACADPNVSLGAGPREYIPGDYSQVLKRWTREDSVIDFAELDDKLTVTATFESWDFRWAYVVRYADDYRLSVEQRRELLQRTLQETADNHEFYIAIYGTNWRWTDLSRPTSAWIVRLVDDQGNETAPSKIDSIVKPGPLEQRYFPYTTVWRRAFRIRFPRVTGDGRPTIADSARWFGLRFAGAEGNGELRWKVESGAAPSP